MATKSNVFDVDTIKPRKGNDLDISDNGHLKMNPKVENVNYDKKAKEGTFASRKMRSIGSTFDYFILKTDGSIAFRIADHVNLKGGVEVTAFAAETYPNEDEE